MGKQRLAWKSENHPTSLDGVWGKAAFNEGVQGSNSPLLGTPLQTKTAPATMPHASQQPGMAVAGSQAWMGLLFTAFPRNKYTKALHKAFPFPNRKQDCWICVQIPLLTVPLSWCTKSLQCTEGQSEERESWLALPSTRYLPQPGNPTAPLSVTSSLQGEPTPFLSKPHYTGAGQGRRSLVTAMPIPPCTRSLSRARLQQHNTPQSCTAAVSSKLHSPMVPTAIFHQLCEDSR